jgi:hypothetical protein
MVRIQVFTDTTLKLRTLYTFCMLPDERIRELCAQLLRTHHPEVIQIVADQLKGAIDRYVATVQNDFPVFEPSPK